MTNEEKAQEISEKNRRYHLVCSSLDCFLSAMDMAKWKDDKLKNIIDKLKDEYIKNSGKGLYSNEEVAAKLATLKRIEEEMK